MESHKRSITKAMSWRIIALTITTLTVYFFTGDEVLSLGAGLVDSAIKIFAYYGHERLWIKVKFGLKRVGTGGLELKDQSAISQEINLQVKTPINEEEKERYDARS